MWEVNATNMVLKSKDMAWKPTNLKISGNTITSDGNKILEVINTEGTNFQVKSMATPAKQDSQMWKQTNYDNGFFTLTNKMTAKVLTAVAPNDLDIIGMYICIRNFS